MSIENTQDADEPSPASDGSVAGKPVAWFVDGVGYPYATVIRERAQAWADSDGGVIVPLYRQPQPALTDAEREAVEAAAADDVSDAQVYDAEYSEELRARAATLRGLLERLG